MAGHMGEFGHTTKRHPAPVSKLYGPGLWLFGSQTVGIRAGASLRDQGQNTERTSGPTYDFQRGGDNYRTDRWNFVQVDQVRQAELAVAMHHVVVTERGVEAGGLSSVGSDGFDTHAEDVALFGKKERRFLLPARRVWPFLVDVQEGLGRGSLRPVRTKQNPTPGRDAAMPLLPRLDVRNIDKIVRVFFRFVGSIEDGCGTDEEARRDLVHAVRFQILPADPVDRSIEVRARVLAG